MSADELDDPIPTDASTIHRGYEQAAGKGANGPDSAPAADPSPADTASEKAKPNIFEPISEAKTVIRAAPKPSDLQSIGRTPAAVAKVLLGNYLDHFRLDEMIGGGGMGAVFRAHDEQLDRTVAIKVIPFVGDDPDLQRRFRNEAQSAAKLDHPRIASVYGVGLRGDWHYLVFEYIAGTNIRDQVQASGPLSIDESVFFTCELAQALQHASERGIVHRDIKPSNVLISGDNIKLVDMGLARSEHLELSEDMTASGVTLGTFDYISPEQARDPRDADIRSDIYSLGCTLYFMLTGQPPYPGGTMLQKLLSHGNAPPPNARELRSEVSDSLASVIQKMLAKDPADRYQNARDLVADLREVAFQDNLARSQGIETVVVRQSNPLVLWLEKHAPWIVAGSILLLTAGWLELSSAASRFSINVPDTAKPPIAEVNPLVAATVDLQKGSNDQTGSPSESSPDSAAPPRLQDLPVPPELSDTPAPEIITPDPNLAFGQTDAAIDLAMSQIAPKEIRVVGRREAMDLLLDPRERYQNGILLSPSLSSAIEEAERFNVDNIRIAAPVIYTEPVKVNTDGLLIASSVGGSMVVFEGSDEKEMFSIGPNRIEIDDVHFVWNVTDESSPNGGSLIGINNNRLVRFTDCSLTIKNVQSRDSIYAFAIRSEADSVDPFPLVALELNNVIVRGQATMIQMKTATQLQLQWENGLLAVSRRMMDVGGVRGEVGMTIDPIQLSLTRVTADTPLGLIRMQMDADTVPMMIDREANKCLFSTNTQHAHVEFVGFWSGEDPTSLVTMRGESNVYDASSETDLMLELSDEAERLLGSTIRDVRRQAPVWFKETSARWRAYWPPDRRTDVADHLQTLENFSQDGTVLSGFDPKSLPLMMELEVGEFDTSAAQTP